MRRKGKITTWNDDKGFGFIEPYDGGDRVFIHAKAVPNRGRRPVANDVVTFGVAKDRQGRTRAVNATLAGDRLNPRSKPGSGKSAVMVSSVFLASVAVSAFVTELPAWVPGAYVFLSLATFLAYAVDKSAAQSGRRRVSEGTLQFLGLAGGWPGALIAQQSLRHKTRKASFRSVFRATVAMNVAGLFWLHTRGGLEFLQ